MTKTSWFFLLPIIPLRWGDAELKSFDTHHHRGSASNRARKDRMVSWQASDYLSKFRSETGKAEMATRKTGKRAASAAGKTLASKSSSKAAKRAAASDLSQVGNSRRTGPAAASAAGKTLRSKKSSKAAKRAAASDLSQRKR